MNRRLTLTALVVASALVITGPALHAQQDYPNKPIRLIVDGPAGGINDIWARRYASQIGPALKQTIVIENRSGASGTLSAEALTQAAPDGYTVYNGGLNPLVIYPGAGGQVRYDPVKDFLPIALGTMGFPSLVAGPSLGVKTLGEAITKVGGAERTCGTGGVASVGHFACVQFARAAKIKLLTVPYKAGALAVIDAASGQVDFASGFYSEIEGMVNSNRVAPLAVYGPQRLPKFPNVPTMAEAGLPGLDLPSFSGFFVPAGTPMSIVNRLHTELLAAMKKPELADVLSNAGGVYQVMSQEAFADFYRREIAKWKKMSADTGIRVEQ